MGNSRPKRFLSITKGYYKDSQGLFLLYDLTNKDIFDNLNIWINGVRQSLGTDIKEKNKYIVVLLGNKLYLSYENPDYRKVPEKEVLAKCKEFDIIQGGGGVCSAKDFTVEELEEKFKIYTKDKIGNNITKSQKAIKIASQKRKEKYLC